MAAAVIPYVQDADFRLYVGDVRQVLAGLPAESVDCCVTSPPYYGLRDYGTGTWDGGDPQSPFYGKCDHKASLTDKQYERICGKCGARRVDQQIGLEASPEEFVAEMVAVFRQVRRVLAPHGTLWLNLGDAFESKQLQGMPWRVAFALQQPYYMGRIAAERDRVWLAAILDGEGTICGMRHVRPDGNVRTGCMTFITNTSEALLDECDRIWRGSRYSEKVTSEVARPCWRWELQSAADRSAFVRELYPYLIEKKQQALVAWNLLEIVQDAKRLGRGGESTATKEKRDHLVRLLGDLNQRRPADLPSWLEVPPSLHEQGWYLRMDNIWAKNNPMPESVTDRPTKAHEYVFLLSKQPRYFFDAQAIAEPAAWERWGDQTIVKPQPGTASWIKPKSKQELTGESRPGGRGDTYSGFNGRYAADDPASRKTRNIRSVWEIATQPYPDAHFATFPEALPERCIKAGCPEFVCVTCGKPRVRIVEKDFLSAPIYKDAGSETSLTAGRNRNVTRMGDGVNVTTLGWSDCGHGNYRPGVVLDPFIGSGTTALVARRHGRHTIGIELNPEYADLAARRLSQLSLLAEEQAG